MTKAEQRLWRRWKEHGDEQAYAALVARHERFVYDFARRVSGDGADAEDLAQEAFLDLAEAPLEKPVLVGLRPFLGRSVVLGAKTLRRTALSRALRDRKAAEAVATLTPADPGARQDVEAALALLDEEQRHAVILRFLYDLSFRELAHVLSITESAARMRVHRALGRLRDRLGPGANASIAALALLSPPLELGKAIATTATHAAGVLAMSSTSKTTAPSSPCCCSASREACC